LATGSDRGISTDPVIEEATRLGGGVADMAGRCARSVTDVTLFADDEIKQLYRPRTDTRGEHFERISLAGI
jgi:hypothetical protein